MKHLTILLIAVMAGVAWGQYPDLMAKPTVWDTRVNYIIDLHDYRTQPITWGELEEFLADTSTMDSVYIDWGAAMRDKSGELKWGPRWISPPYPKTLPGLLAWIKRKEK
jgi:hypothetical protein